MPGLQGPARAPPPGCSAPGSAPGAAWRRGGPRRAAPALEALPGGCRASASAGSSAWSSCPPSPTEAAPGGRRAGRRRQQQLAPRCRSSAPDKPSLPGPPPLELDTGQLDAQQQPAAPPQLDKRKLWVAAVKPKMYAVAVIPVLVASAAAYAKCRVPFYGRLGLLLGGAVSNIAWLNLSNDVFDSTTGADAQKAESIVNLTGKRTPILWLANGMLALSAALLCQVAVLARDKRVVLLLGFAIAMGYMYQGPPFRLSYKGLGEPLCFLAFGPFAVSAFYFAMIARRASGALPMLSTACFAASVAVGLTTTAVLFCSHFHQVAGDKAVGKMSPLVRLGTGRGVQVLSWAILGLYLFLGLCIWGRALPLHCGLVFPASFPAALALLTFAWETHTTPEKVRPLKLYALEWHTAVGLALAAGLAISPLPMPPFIISSLHELQALYHTG